MRGCALTGLLRRPLGSECTIFRAAAPSGAHLRFHSTSSPLKVATILVPVDTLHLMLIFAFSLRWKAARSAGEGQLCPSATIFENVASSSPLIYPDPSANLKRFPISFAAFSSIYSLKNGEMGEKWARWTHPRGYCEIAQTFRRFVRREPASRESCRDAGRSLVEQIRCTTSLLAVLERDLSPLCHRLQDPADLRICRVDLPIKRLLLHRDAVVLEDRTAESLKIVLIGRMLG